MLIRNATRKQIDKALAFTNERYSGNIDYRRCDYDGMTRTGGSKYQVTLRTLNSSGPGGRVSLQGRRIGGAACWHVHGVFMDALPKDAEIVSSMPERKVKHPGDPWDDWKVSAPIMPDVYISELCKCANGA
jgi:hypothetical protein